MNLIWNWKAVLTKGFSSLFNYGTILFAVMELVQSWSPETLSFLDALFKVAPGTFAGLAVICGILSGIGRIIKQPSVSKDADQ
ncbi:MAG: hypothetical protein DI533_00470 [Cereibacter sphaeroides]|uniref:Uncharacterized protein n=1 Tax=Cereibacter sphaeroides TaxID=1063 RepID=A0A2W5SBI3_CERSP|nr:MAG: hypothetical protein DI533_00470 [Cereibacter sphaeroides]